MVSFKAHAEKSTNVVNDLLAPDRNTLSVKSPLQRCKQVQVSIEVVKIRSDFLVDGKKIVIRPRRPAFGTVAER